MRMQTLLSWNVNGLRAIYKKRFVSWLKKTSPDILAIQETKIHNHDIPFDMKNIERYHIYFSSGVKKGYSGVALYSKEQPISIKTGFGNNTFDSEGRILIATYKDFIFCNVYFPNGGSSAIRLKYKMDFYEYFLYEIDNLKKTRKHIIFCGDINTAHKEIDLARPKENSKRTGFLPQERTWIDKVIKHGYIDTFRIFHQEPHNYSWWDYKTKARERNVGWRIDYFFVSENFKKYLNDAFILDKVQGSDHCPVGITISL